MQLKLERIIDDEKDKKLTEQVIRENYDLFKDTYSFLLASTTDYPQVDIETLYSKFVVGLELENLSQKHLSHDKFLTLIQQDSGNKDGVVPITGHIYRFQLIELMIKVAVLVYQPSHYNNEVITADGERRPPITLISQALRCLLKQSVRPFRDKIVPKL